MKRFLLLLSVILMISCAGIPRPTPEQLAVADYGKFPAEYKKIAENYIKDTLIDPYSAVFDKWKGPEKGYITDRYGNHFGYFVCVHVNAKNRGIIYLTPSPFKFSFLLPCGFTGFFILFSLFFDFRLTNNQSVIYLYQKLEQTTQEATP